MGRYHSTSDAHFEVGDRVLVRGVPACVRMETATQVLVVFDAESQEEWVPKSSPALTLARDAASSAAKEAAAAAPPPAPVDPAEELSSDVEDDECCVRPSLPFPNPASEARLLPPCPPSVPPVSAFLSGAQVCGNGGKLTCCDVCPRVYHLRCLPPEDRAFLQESGDQGEWWCPHCRRLSRLTFCTFRILSESCTPQHASADAEKAAEALFDYMVDEQHDEQFDVLREAGQGLMATMAHVHPWRYADRGLQRRTGRCRSICCGSHRVGPPSGQLPRRGRVAACRELRVRGSRGRRAPAAGQGGPRVVGGLVRADRADGDQLPRRKGLPQ